MNTVTSKAPAPRAASPPRAVAAGTRSSLDPLKLLRRHWILLGCMGVLGGGLGLAAYMVLNEYAPRYSGSVTFLLTPQLDNPLDTGARISEPSDAVLRAMKTEAQYLTNERILGTALRESKDIRDRTTWAQQFKDGTGNFSFDEAVRDLRKHLSTNVGRDINLFELTWSTEHPADVPVVLNILAATYLVERAKREDAQFDAVLQQFVDRVTDLDRKIDDNQAKMQEFITQNNLSDVENARNTQLQASAADLLRNINEATAQQGLARSIQRQTDEKLSGVAEFNQDDRRIAEDDPNIRGLRTQLNNYRLAAAGMRDKFAAGHPEVQEMTRQLKAAENEYELAVRARIEQDLEARLRDAILEGERADKMRADLDEEYKVVEKKLRDTQALISAYQNQKRATDALVLDREELQKVVRDIRVMKSRDDAKRVRVAFDAETPREKSFPNMVLFVGMGALLGLGLTGGIIFLRELLDQGVKSGSDVAAIPGARVLGTIPDIEDDPTNCERAELVVAERPQSVLAEAYRQASVPLMDALDAGESCRVLVVVGGLPGAGTSTVVSNIAAVEVAAGRRVVVLDANFRRPALARIYSIPEDGPGLGDLLAGKAELDECAIRVPDGPMVIPAGRPASRVYERLQTAQLDVLLGRLRSEYDLVLVDAPPAVVAGESMSLARKADAVVLVIRANQEQRGLVARLVRQLGEMRGDFLGVIFNRPRGTAGGYFRKNYATIAEYARPT